MSSLPDYPAPEARREDATAARVEQLYTWDAAMHGLLAVYREALSSTPASVPNYAAS